MDHNRTRWPARGATALLLAATLATLTTAAACGKPSDQKAALLATTSISSSPTTAANGSDHPTIPAPDSGIRSSPAVSPSTSAATSRSAPTSGQILDGEPTTPRTGKTPVLTTTVVPPAPTGTASFSYSAKIEVSAARTDKIEGGCPTGWYVRPGTPSYYERTLPTAAYSYSDETWVFHVEDDDSTSGTIPNTHGGTIFTGLSVSFYNSSIIHSHYAQLTWWCDAVPTWYTSSSAAKASAAPVPTASRSNSVKGLGPVPSNCWYCSQNNQIVNAGTGLALDPSSASVGNAVLVNNVDNGADQDWYLQGQTGGSAFVDELATFGLWQEATELSTAVGTSGNSTTWASASAEPPSGGRFFYVDQGAGLINSWVQFISTDSGLCLASPASAGSAATMQTCDATDLTQWWKVPNPV